MIFAINTYGHWSGGFQNSFEIDIFGAGPDPEFSIISLDEGLATTGDFDGKVLSLVIDDSDDSLVDAWVADAPANGSTILMPALASEIDRATPGDTIDYEVFGDNISDSAEVGDIFEDTVAGRASIDVFSPAVSNGDFLKVDTGQTRTLSLDVDETAQGAHPSLGWMIVTLDDSNGAAQADLVAAPALP